MCKKKVNKVNNFTCLDSSMCVTMVTPPYKQTASSVSITGIFHGSLPISPLGRDGAGLRGEKRWTRVDLGNKPHQSIRTASLPGGHACVFPLCVFWMSTLLTENWGWCSIRFYQVWILSNPVLKLSGVICRADPHVSQLPPLPWKSMSKSAFKCFVFFWGVFWREEGDAT